jgi:hypothetical protein
MMWIKLFVVIIFSLAIVECRVKFAMKRTYKSNRYVTVMFDSRIIDDKIDGGI